MSARFSFGRRSTNTSTSTAASGSSMASSARSFVKGRTMSWRDREQRKRESVLVEDFYLMYELDWSALRDWLQARFPGLDFREEYVRGVSAVLQLPLTPKLRIVLAILTSSTSRESSPRLVWIACSPVADP